MTELEKGLEKLNELVERKQIDLNDFYCISLDRERLALQGEFSNDTFRKYEALVDLEYDKETRWFSGRKDGIKMVLTLD